MRHDGRRWLGGGGGGGTHTPSGSKWWIQEWDAKSGSAMDFLAYMSAPPKRKVPNWPFPSTSHPSAPTCSNGYSP